MNEQGTHSRSAYLCGGFLFLIAIAGNLSVPWLLDRSFPFQNSHSPYARIYFQLWITVYEGLVSFCAGLWIAQYFVSWIWLNAHVANTVMRWMLGIFCSLTISCTVALGMFNAWGAAEVAGYFCIAFSLSGLGIYIFSKWVLGMLLRRSNIAWRLNSSKPGCRYSVRLLLGAMVGSAIFMILAIESFPLCILAIGIAWMTLAMAILVWLQLGSFFHLRRVRFWIAFLVTMVVGPPFVFFIGGWLLSMEWRFNAFAPERVWLSYAVELGLVLGVGIVIPLLPRAQRREPAAVGSNVQE